jgi:hypothetical protein
MLTAAGLLGFRAMKIQQFPDIDLPMVSVTASLPGAAPAQMETEVARKIENALASAQGLKHLYTKVQDGVATVTAEFRLEKPTQEAVDDVRDAVSRVRSELPADLRDPVVAKLNLAGTAVLSYTVASASLDEEALSWYVDNTVAKRMLAVRGVGAVARVGGVTREVQVALDPTRMLALGVTAAELSRQLRTCSRRPRAAAPSSAAPSSRCAPSPPCRRPPSWRAGDPAGRRPPHAPRPGGDGQRHGGRAALGGLLNGKPVVGFEMVRALGAGEVDVARGRARRWPS